MTSSLTDNDIAAMSSLHRERQDGTGKGYCVACSFMWPCHAAVLLAEVERFRDDPFHNRLVEEVEQRRAGSAEAIVNLETENSMLVAEVERLREEYDWLRGVADAEVGRLRIKAGEEQVPLCHLCDHPAHEDVCSTVCDDECVEGWE